jgi:predicted Zn-dependent peptidase
MACTRKRRHFSGKNGKGQLYRRFEAFGIQPRAEVSAEAAVYFLREVKEENSS